MKLNKHLRLLLLVVGIVALSGCGGAPFACAQAGDIGFCLYPP